ncbi:MAG: glutamine--fructose-6-phosphate transaminase (isomerizing) [Patescibacteria group bacterium]
MCGIVGYAGNKDAKEILIEGLHRLEYRGYDSAGLAFQTKDGIVLCKTAGRVLDLEKKVSEDKIGDGVKSGIAHTRWATHGAPNETNAHPHLDCFNQVAVVHNGIIENHTSLKTYLRGRGHVFRSETDTEIVPHLIEEFLKEKPADFLGALTKTLQTIRGSYALAILNFKEPKNIYAAHLSSPLVIGRGSEENFLASDATPFLGRTKDIIYLPEREIAIINSQGVRVFDFENREKFPEVERLEGTLESIQKGKFAHFMLKEIYEQPEMIENTLRGRLLFEEGTAKLGGLENVWKKILNAKRFIISACGTSWHSGLVGKYMLEELARIPTEVEYASEFRYRNPILGKDDVVFSISQSGETADTLAALREAKARGATALGIVNVVGSTIAREVEAGVYIHAGPEIGVASTKAFTSELTALALITLALAREKQGTLEWGRRVVHELRNLPEKVKSALSQEDKTKEIAKIFKNSKNFLYLGRGANFPTALEGALKLKEVSYIHAEGYPAAEMKHGPIALVDENVPVVFIVPKDKIYEKVLSNIEEVKARRGKIIAIANEDDDEIDKLADFVIKVPRTLGWLSPIVNVIPLQLLAYHIALEKGCDIDKPRNLAKSVTVE